MKYLQIKLKMFSLGLLYGVKQFIWWHMYFTLLFAKQNGILNFKLYNGLTYMQDAMSYTCILMSCWLLRSFFNLIAKIYLKGY